MPHIISESGRALTAHHALLLLKVIDVESQAEAPVPSLTRRRPRAAARDGRGLSSSLRRGTIAPRKVLEVFHDATFDKDRAQQLLQQRRAVAARARDGGADVPRHDESRSTRSCNGDRDEYEDILPDLDAALVDRYFCNFSLFQSLPDSWAIDQLFPIMPIHRLRRGADAPRHAAGHHLRLRRQDRPLRRGQEGRPSPRAARVPRRRALHARHLPHRRVPGDPRRPAQPVRRHERRAHPADATSGYEITDLVHGDTVTEVLNYVQFRASAPARRRSGGR